MEKIQDLKCQHGNSARSGQKIEPDGQISQSYGLRENPKKTMRGVDQDLPLPHDRVCKQCGKVFQSMKALCGHMACHSEKKLVIESDSDADVEERKCRRKGKGKRYNKIAKSDSSVSEIDEKDEEEMVVCLMLLSRDYASCRGGVDSVGESSDNNSGVLETKSRSNEDEVLDLDKTGDKKLNYSSSLDAEDSDSDSGYFLDDVSMSDTEKRTEVRKELAQEYGTDNGRIAMKTWKNESTYADDELVVESYKKIKYGSAYAEVLNTQQQKRSKYECFDCKRSFKSYQALGGHRPCLKRNNVADDATDQEPIHNPELCLGNKKVKSKKQKGYACPFCERVFKSGQALGGHKRSHFLVANAGFANQSLETKPVVDDLFDLNLPAPQDENENNMI